MMVKQQPKKKVWFVYLILGTIAAIGIAMGLFFSSHPSWVGEQAGNADYVHRTLGLLSDLPHMTAELFYDAIENSIVFCIAFLIARRAFRKEHELFDMQHGISHEH
jgi:type III secretory pathway component EscT